ncbi:copper homeostasis CutC domain-containing protein [Xylogone sp. PMI_703]|nr:copper homeostasis CutC domain-containing protein [Xylogone sp. PMI_703]
MPPPLLEIACFNAISAINAYHGDASRLELCAHKHLDGVTPSLATYLEIVSRLSQLTDSSAPSQNALSSPSPSPLPIPINVMIRPNPSPDFTASAQDFEEMKASIQEFRSSRVPPSGFVFGILDAAGWIDVARNKELVDLASPLPCTFHRAFDLAAGADDEDRWETSVEDLVGCGFTSVLTSGGSGELQNRAARIERITLASKGRVRVIVGGGVRSSNVEELRQVIERGDGRVDAWHSSAVVEGGEVDSEGEVVANVDEVRALRSAILR